MLEQGTTARRVAYAGSVQSDVGGIYGQAKADAATRLTGAANRVGAEFHDLRLPNLFGEHGRPFYNAVTATFCHLLARGERPRVDVDRGLRLLHAQDAADLLVGTFPSSDLETLVQELSVVELLERLTAMAATYSTGDIPDVAQKVDRDLFNTYRSYVTELRPAVPLVRHSDARGSFFEIARTHGGPGQSSFSTTKPGIVRGEHFHRRKIERFTVLSGRAVISLRRLFGTEVVHVEVDGEHPLAVDMPTLWAHNIQNVGDELLYTSFWTDDIFDPTRPDTIAEVV
ncbi:UDP-2-acetamido-2,6-beta-L-arabino-hexul-4-ose reductase [Cellulomonas humilata]|uniref:UDP-2-acetamido-2,6-beta-L-arabino-hexul-4-ose reductase n=1 Tax=Cellulomonas humilata TaxID=144055 RepID=A0ABU0EG28_9CELL|nr:capsular biosynthesis protein [Cellulomonas humilata]MDQ0374225.1 UDP-2-acetamido-2,6-beta-L-arabino-hexul-4-ose reductase [Cellulomonas humilata]